MSQYFVIAMLPALCILLVLGFPVAFTLAGVALIFATLGYLMGIFDPIFLGSLPNRIFGIMGNELLIAVPLFIFMGLVLERSRIAEELLETMGALFRTLRGGLAISVTVVGALLAASTGIVGATVVAMGLLSLPTMLKYGYSPRLACGSICAAGTLGQIIPPSIVLILLADQVSSAYRTGQMSVGNMMPDPVSVLDLFAGALIPGLILVGAYVLLQLAAGFLFPRMAPPVLLDRESGDPRMLRRVVFSLLPPLALMVAVLGSIVGGIATPTEAGSIGALGAMLLAAGRRQLTLANMRSVVRSTTELSAMIFSILIGAALFALVFRGFDGDTMVHEFLSGFPGGATGALILLMVTVFLLGFFLDFIEIVLIVIPIAGPPLFALGVEPVWFAILMAINLQTSFLTPPFGFALFYLQGVTPPEVGMGDIYRGIVPFIAIQLLVLGVVALVPETATWLPELLSD
ncbi:MAG: TRAP transporter large permease subunit [Gammaproteobacteria bacterium]|nr:TRAP transporter large permease subunit [Gammaproteobacteria bacterium]NIR82921.1 TRAP transporter large permease subunit [Gammaproteobacteria bacterium]NIR90190.1 TRAP transporter large permease subunit [Gammaproteobacteria bacterium]NIU04067.1 TRAP transporter large permease subunit [Gammaproteobacteria bacterium]NIV51056.1 TRAP transporter large permease subunit [Gammaproteobacteria bacterium]